MVLNLTRDKVLGLNWEVAWISKDFSNSVNLVVLTNSFIGFLGLAGLGVGFSDFSFKSSEIPLSCLGEKSDLMGDLDLFLFESCLTGVF